MDFNRSTCRTQTSAAQCFHDNKSKKWMMQWLRLACYNKTSNMKTNSVAKILETNMGVITTKTVVDVLILVEVNIAISELLKKT